jgi:curli biogenesis system outer membrane secretion channel CsgG
MLGLCGCARFPVEHGRGPDMKNPELVYPVLAVADFENRANFRGYWQLGDGFSDMLVTRLLKRGDVVVLERHHLGDILNELELQQNEVTRDEGQRAYGQLKNVEYIVRGVITDFTVTGDASGWFSSNDVRVRGGRSSARVTLNIKVVDVETGQILTSIESSGKASSGFFGGGVNYKDVAFGGEAYFRTPLGQATNEAMDKALSRLIRSLPKKEWQARIADVVEKEVIINGGKNVDLEPGTIFTVVTPGREIEDPVTGNVIHRLSGQAVGRVLVTDVLAQSSVGRLLEGQAKPGAMLVKAPRERVR